MCVGYAAAQTVSVTIPTNAKASSTVLRWRQLTHSGSALDEWAIDHVLLTKVEVGSYTQISVLSDNFDTAPSIPYDSSTVCSYTQLISLYFVIDTAAHGGLQSTEGRLKPLIVAALIWSDTVLKLLSSASQAPDTFKHSV